eukprot:TRINITY_DN11021_c2_g1_i1.p1 TRINITY_DN11021_c2_g1~~TRINITY_DN11021_c2_g1_i1.p1  ORF type:complete len:344 (+),score=72.96 TRINITY_DN11021_c2_g1_i1:44-1033(+)
MDAITIAYPTTLEPKDMLQMAQNLSEKPETPCIVDGNSFLKGAEELNPNFSFFVWRGFNATDVKITGADTVSVLSLGTTPGQKCPLAKLDCSSLIRINSITDRFCAESMLQTLDLSHMGNLSRIGSDFMKGCSNLRKINFPQNSKIENIGDYFLEGCRNLQSVDASVFGALKSVGSHFLANCESIQFEARLLPSNIQKGDGFLEGTSPLVPASSVEKYCEKSSDQQQPQQPSEQPQQPQQPQQQQQPPEQPPQQPLSTDISSKLQRANDSMKAELQLNLARVFSCSEQDPRLRTKAVRSEIFTVVKELEGMEKKMSELTESVAKMQAKG